MTANSSSGQIPLLNEQPQGKAIRAGVLAPKSAFTLTLELLTLGSLNAAKVKQGKDLTIQKPRGALKPLQNPHHQRSTDISWNLELDPDTANVLPAPRASAPALQTRKQHRDNASQGENKSRREKQQRRANKSK